MKTLETYTRNGYTFTLVKRLGNHAVFRGVRKNGTVTTYETIKVLSHNGREIHGKKIPPAEYAPCDATWGSKGWTYTTEEMAINALDMLEPV